MSEPGPAVVRASVGLYADDPADLLDLDGAGLAGRFVAAVVEIEGDDGYLTQVPAAYLDEVLLREPGRAARQRAALIRDWAVRMLDAIWEQPRHALGPIHLFERIDDATPYVVVETTVDAECRSRSSFRPRRHAGKSLDAAFWGYWNFVVSQLLDVDPGGTQPLLSRLVDQLDYYGAEGFKRKNLGKAVAHANQRFLNQRFVGQVAWGAGMTLEEFEALPESEQSRMIHFHLDAQEDADEAGE
jgi:hypothetical protein